MINVSASQFHIYLLSVGSTLSVLNVKVLVDLSTRRGPMII